jgi:hypothetical protein
MARELPEMGYFEENGTVSHGIIGLTPGRRITQEEANVLSAQKRAREQQPSAARVKDVEAELADLKAERDTAKVLLRAIESEVASLKGALVDLLAQAKGG